MAPPQTEYPYSVTCETHDEAVLHCLSALAHFAEHAAVSPMPEPASTSSTLDAWAREEGRITFRFSDQRGRGTFLGEATRLLSGKWTRLALGGDPVRR